MNDHKISSVELVVFRQASHVSNPLRHQAQELLRQASAHDLAAAQEIIEAHGLEGQAIGIDRDEKGKPLAIKWKPRENLSKEGSEAL